MSDLISSGGFFYLGNASDYRKFQKDFIEQYGRRSESSFLRDGELFLRFPSSPESYPCLVTGVVLGVKGTVTKEDAGTFNPPGVTCCFVYPSDAEFLLGGSSNFGEPPSIAPAAADGAHAATEHIDAEAAPPRRIPCPDTSNLLISLVTALAAELVDIGALNLERLYETWSNADHLSEVDSSQDIKSQIKQFLDGQRG